MTSIPFLSPCTAIISGPTASGKSTFIFKVLRNLRYMFNEPVYRVYYFHGVWQKLFDTIEAPNVEFIKDLPTQEHLESIADDKHNLIVIDDLQFSALNNAFVANLFSREAHHRNISVFLILQNLFHQGKYCRDISLNTHYFILFKNPRDVHQIRHLGSQLDICKKLLEAYRDATASPFSYLLIDLAPASDSSYMLRSNIFPKELAIVYK